MEDKTPIENFREIQAMAAAREKEAEQLQRAVLGKLVGMFSPYPGKVFLDHPGSETICGPNDRAVTGFDTNFPKQWLMDDFDFTEEEADWLIREVRIKAAAPLIP
jgi:hypothetical protein